MKIAIVGGHGQIALKVTEQLTSLGHSVVSIIRNDRHSQDLLSRGAIPAVVDIERARVHELADVIRDSDAVIFAAGAGPGSGPERKWTVDRDGAMLTADAAQIAGVNRLVVISAMKADEADQHSDDVFQIYLRAKAEADDSIRSRDMDWTIIRPGRLTDEPGTGLVTVGTTLTPGSITRQDVADLVAQCILQRAAVRVQFDAINGDTAISEALETLE